MLGDMQLLPVCPPRLLAVSGKEGTGVYVEQAVCLHGQRRRQQHRRMAMTEPMGREMRVGAAGMGGRPCLAAVQKGGWQRK